MRGGVPRCVAQATPQFDAEIAEKGHLWMETNLQLLVWFKAEFLGENLEEHEISCEKAKPVVRLGLKTTDL